MRVDLKSEGIAWWAMRGANNKLQMLREEVNPSPGENTAAELSCCFRTTSANA